jgi:hypothetical protein
MTPLFVAAAVAALMMTGAMGGALLRRNLPSRHFDEEALSVLKLGLGFLATLSALVMGLVISSSKASYDAKAEMVHSAAALIIRFDASLRQIGPEADPIRQVLKDTVGSTMRQFWGEQGAVSEPSDPVATKRQVWQLEKMLFALSLSNEMQRQAQASTFKLIEELARINAAVFTQRGSDVVIPLLAVVACWMTLNIAGWNLFAPPSRMVMVVNLVCALSVASAVFFILEIDQPFDGFISISDAPLRAALLVLSE